MERARGLSFVRGTLVEEPLSETDWVKTLGFGLKDDKLR